MSKTIRATIQNNNYVGEYTSEQEMTAYTIYAPKINLLPYDIWSSNFTISGLNDCYINYNGMIHYDFNNLPYTANKVLFGINNIQNICELSKGIYTISYHLSDVSGTYSLVNANCVKAYRIIGENIDRYTTIGSITIKPGSNESYAFQFNVNDNELITNIYIGYQFLQWATSGKDLNFNFTFLGMTKGEIPIYRQTNSSSESPQMFSENTNYKVGDYKLSINIVRHLLQIERHIAKYNNE